MMGKTSKDVIEELRKGNQAKAFDTFFSIVGYHSFLEKCHLTDLSPHVPHTIYLCIERIACKTHEGGYASLDISLDWLKQELTIRIDPFIKEVIPITLDNESERKGAPMGTKGVVTSDALKLASPSPKSQLDVTNKMQNSQVHSEKELTLSDCGSDQKRK